MVPRNQFLSAASLVGAGLAIGLLLSACGLGRDNGDGESVVRDPVVAATVNGRPIYIEDVRSHAGLDGDDRHRVGHHVVELLSDP